MKGTRVSEYWSPKENSLFLGEFEDRDLYATRNPQGRMEFVAIGDAGLSFTSEQPTTHPLTLEEEAEGNARWGIAGYRSATEECKRRWWAQLSSEEQEAAEQALQPRTRRMCASL